MSAAVNSELLPAGAEQDSAAQEKELATFQAIQAANQHFDTYESQYQEAMVDLDNEPVLEEFLQEYRTLHNSFLRCNEGERRLLSKCHDLRVELLACTTKVQTAHNLSLEDKETKKRLESEIQRSKERTAACADRERSLQESAAALKDDVVELQRRLEAGPVKDVSHDTALYELRRTVEALHEKDGAQAFQLGSLRRENDLIERRVAEAMERGLEKEQELAEARYALKQQEDEVTRLQSKKNRSETMLQDLRDKLILKTRVLGEQGTTIESLKERAEKKKKDIEAVNHSVEKVESELMQITRKAQNLDTSVQACNEENDALQHKVNDLMVELTRTEMETAAVGKESAKEMKVLDALRRRNAIAVEKRQEAIQRKEALLEEVQRREEELQLMQDKADSEEALVKATRKELNAVRTDLSRAETRTASQQNWYLEKCNQKKLLEHKRTALMSHAHKQTVRVHQVTKEAVQYEEEAQAIATVAAELLDTVAKRQRDVDQIATQQRDLEKRLRTQRDLLDMVLRERHIYTKHFIRLRDHVGSANKHFKWVLQQVQQVKTDIERLDRSTAVEEQVIAKLERIRKETIMSIDAARRKADRTEKTADVMQHEMMRIRATISAAEDESGRQQRDAQAALNERNTFSGQAISREQELKDLYNRLRVQRTLLQKTEEECVDGQNEVDVLEKDVNALAEELGNLQDVIRKLPELQRMGNSAEKALRQEQLRVRALRDEAESKHGVHVHANRQRAWCAPHTAALAEQVRKTQRQLVEATAELDRVTKLIEQREAEYLSLKAVAAKLPGPEVAETLQMYKEALPKRTGQLKAMKDNLREFHEQVDLYKNRLEDLNKELEEVHADYSRRREAEEKEDLAATAASSKGDTAAQKLASEPIPSYRGFVAPARVPSPPADRKPDERSATARASNFSTGSGGGGGGGGAPAFVSSSAASPPPPSNSNADAAPPRSASAPPANDAGAPSSVEDPVESGMRLSASLNGSGTDM